MFIGKPGPTLQLMDKKEEITSSGTHWILDLRRERSAYLRDNRDAVPSRDAYAEAAEFMSGITELQIGTEEVKALLDLYPHVRIDLATREGCTDSSVREGLSFIAAHFFLGCSWPTYGDEVDVEAFISLLQAQAVRIGYTRTNFRADESSSSLTAS